MKFLLSSLLLACHCALSSWSVSSGPHLIITPDYPGMEGTTVNISCCWMKESSHLVMKARATWFKNGTEIKNKMNQSVNQSGNCLTLTLSNITREDSGRYGCRLTVEIPVYKVLYGNETVLTVRDAAGNETLNENPDDPSLHSYTVTAVAVGVGVAVPLFIVTLVCFCILRRKHGSAEAARVIYEVPHIDSEVADADKHSTSSSRGSSQWCQVPVYESFDYFEHMPTKQSG